MSDGAVNVRDFPALTADEVVMVVAHPCLVSRGTSRRLDATEQPHALQRVQGVVDRLEGDLPDAVAYATVNGVHVEMIALANGLQDSEAGSRHPEPGPPESVRILHRIHRSSKPEQFK